MSSFTQVVPQTEIPLKTTTLREVVELLPEVLPWPVNVWLGDTIVRYGKTSATNLLFFAEQREEPSVEMRTWFNDLVMPLGITATVSENWKDSRFCAVRLYNEGCLNVDKTTMTYKELPTEVHEAPVLTVEDVLSKLPATVPFTQEIYLTGSLVKNGWSGKDADFLVPSVQDKTVLGAMRKFFTNILGWRVDVGTFVMAEREPVFMFKLYENGEKTWHR